MQIPKSLLLVCAAVVCILPQSVRAADTDAQVKAREALRKKINELQPQPGAVETAAPAQVPVAAGSLDEKTRAAMRQKMNELQAQPAPVVTPPAKTPVPQVIKPAPRCEAQRKFRRKLFNRRIVFHRNKRYSRSPHRPFPQTAVEIKLARMILVIAWPLQAFRNF